MNKKVKKKKRWIFSIFSNFDIEDGQICLWSEYNVCWQKSAFSNDIPIEY